MPNLFSRFLLLAKRWWWMILLGIVLCSGITYVISKLTSPTYRASANILLSFVTSPSSSDNLSASLAATQTYAQLITNPTILNPVVGLHPGLTLKQLNSMITVAPKPSTAVIEVDVDHMNPIVAMQLANEICSSFATYAATNNLTVTLTIFPAVRPVDPLRPHPSQDAAIGALVGLGLAIALVFLFEWFDDRLGGPEEIPDLLGVDVLTVIPQLSRRQHRDREEEASALAEACRMLCASLNAAQANLPFKLVMVTSALAGEGKSTVAAHLASFLALMGKRVLLVDADLRRPTQYHYFDLDNSQGLSRTLLQAHTQHTVEPESQATDIPTLRVLAAGIPSADSAELLQSPLANKLFDYFQKAPFDYILFDTPPLLPVADAQFLASRVHATVLVVDVSKTPRKVLVQAKRVFDRTYTTIVGVALNKSRWPEYGYIREYQRNARPPRTTIAENQPLDIPSANSSANTSTVAPFPAKDKAHTSATVGAPMAEVEDIGIPLTFPVGSMPDAAVPETPSAGDNVARTTPTLHIVEEVNTDPLDLLDPDATITFSRPIKLKPEDEV